MLVSQVVSVFIFLIIPEEVGHMRINNFNGPFWKLDQRYQIYGNAC
jgi:hypothetical protein